MSHALHLAALVPAVVGVCCLAADRRRARVLEAAASILMLLAMLDAALTHVVPVAAWVAMLVAGAIALAAGHRVRFGRRVTDATVMVAHTAIGMVVMAGLLATMGMSSPAATGTPGHAHGGAPIGVLGAAAAVAFAVGSVVVARRRCPPGDRAQYATMGAATLAMGAAALV